MLYNLKVSLHKQIQLMSFLPNNSVIWHYVTYESDKAQLKKQTDTDIHSPLKLITPERAICFLNKTWTQKLGTHTHKAGAQ
jgi:hypothetical protein